MVDFNYGIPLVDSEAITFQATHISRQLLSYGWCDVWRDMPYEFREFIWFSARKSNGFRYDHALVSRCWIRSFLMFGTIILFESLKYPDHSLMVLDLILWPLVTEGAIGSAAMISI